MKLTLIFVFICSICFSTFSQEVDGLQSVIQPKETELSKWYTSSSLRWNVSAFANIVVPAVSLVYEYPFNERLGVEIESGLILSTPNFRDPLLVGEQLVAYRLRIGPKFYLNRDGDTDPFYFRLTLKYDRIESMKFREFLNDAITYQEFILVEENFESIGAILYGGFMTTMAKSRLVIDLSVGLGINQWEEERLIPQGKNLLAEPRSFIANTGNPIAIFSFNFQLGYRFHRSKN